MSTSRVSSSTLELTKDAYTKSPVAETSVDVTDDDEKGRLFYYPRLNKEEGHFLLSLIRGRSSVVLRRVLTEYDYLGDTSDGKDKRWNFDLRTLSRLSMAIIIWGVFDMVSDFLLALSLVRGLKCGDCSTGIPPPSAAIVAFAWILLFTAPLGCVLGALFRLNHEDFRIGAARMLLEDLVGGILGIYCVTLLEPSPLAITSLSISLSSVAIELSSLIYKHCQQNNIRSVKLITAQAFTFLALVSAITIAMVVFSGMSIHYNEASTNKSCSSGRIAEFGDSGSTVYVQIGTGNVYMDNRGVMSSTPTGYVGNSPWSSCSQVGYGNPYVQGKRCVSATSFIQMSSCTTNPGNNGVLQTEMTTTFANAGVTNMCFYYLATKVCRL